MTGQLASICRNGRNVSLISLVLFVLTACGSENHAQQTPSAVETANVELQVLKSPTCGCCQFWIDHAEQAGFSTTIEHPEDLTFEKLQRGIAVQYHSCHTAVSADGFVFEGHIPAKLIQRFLQEKPAGARGLAVPGMPLGSPGMEVGDRFTPYDVLLLNADGSASIYHHVATAAEQY